MPTVDSSTNSSTPAVEGGSETKVVAPTLKEYSLENLNDFFLRYEAYAADKTVKKPAHWFKLIDAPLRAALLDVTGTKKVSTDEEAKKFKKDLFSLDAPATSYDLHTELFTVVMEKSLSVTAFIKYVTNFKRIVSQAPDLGVDSTIVEIFLRNAYPPSVYDAVLPELRLKGTEEDLKAAVQKVSEELKDLRTTQKQIGRYGPAMFGLEKEMGSASSQGGSVAVVSSGTMPLFTPKTGKDERPSGGSRKGIECNFCRRKGHIERFCRLKQKLLKKLRDNPDHKSGDRSKGKGKYSVKCVKKSDGLEDSALKDLGRSEIDVTVPAEVSSILEGGFRKKIRLLPDTGCSMYSVIDEAVVKEIHPALRPVNHTIELANGSEMVINEIATVYVKVEGIAGKNLNFKEECLVMPMSVDSRHQLLLCAETAHKTGLVEIKSLPKIDLDEDDGLEEDLLPDSFDALSEKGRTKVERLLLEYKGRIKSEEFAKVTPVSFELRDPDSVYVADHRHHSLEKTTVINNQIKEWLSQGKIRPSTSEFSSNVTVAPKPDSPGRVCIDCKPLNRLIKGNEFPMPRLDDIFCNSQFIGKKIFAKLDLK
ncbi:hypothetical protein ADUPG1_011982, partial [Aduncisulcus paluster]